MFRLRNVLAVVVVVAFVNGAALALPARGAEVVTATTIEPVGFDATFDDGTRVVCPLECMLWIDPVFRDAFAALVAHFDPFLVCTRSHESSSNGPWYDDGYGAVNPSGTYRGAYQFHQGTWNSTAIHAGRPWLVGVDPAEASVADQDLLALDLYRWQGKAPWLYRC